MSLQITRKLQQREDLVRRYSDICVLSKMRQRHLSLTKLATGRQHLGRSAELKSRKWEKMKFHFGLPVLEPFAVSYSDTLKPWTYEADVNTSV